MRIKLLPKKLAAYSLIEMIVTLVITSVIMIALIGIVITILRVSAITHNRSQTREDLTNFTQFFERDLRNSTRIGECNITMESNAGPSETAGFDGKCEIFTDQYIIWQPCERDINSVPLCQGNSDLCESNGQDKTMCRYIADSAGGVDLKSPTFKFEEIYNLDYFAVETVASSQGNLIADSGETEFDQILISITADVSHPNTNLNISNIVRQSLLTTKNYELVVNNDN